eukprot:scaffold19721_cov60-Phaeocystis_antarctica.AAC.4
MSSRALALLRAATLPRAGPRAVTAEAELRRAWEALSSRFLRRSAPRSPPGPSNRSAAWRLSST